MSIISGFKFDKNISLISCDVLRFGLFPSSHSFVGAIAFHIFIFCFGRSSLNSSFISSIVSGKRFEIAITISWFFLFFIIAFARAKEYLPIPLNLLCVCRLCRSITIFIYFYLFLSRFLICYISLPLLKIDFCIVNLDFLLYEDLFFLSLLISLLALGNCLK